MFLKSARRFWVICLVTFPQITITKLKDRKSVDCFLKLFDLNPDYFKPVGVCIKKNV